MTESDFAVSMTLQSKQLRSVNLLNFSKFYLTLNSKITETNTHVLPFNPANNKRMLSFEYPFQDNKTDERFVYNFLCVGDPYEASIKERLRAKWFDEAKILFGKFKPSGPEKPLSIIAKSRLEDIVE